MIAYVFPAQRGLAVLAVDVGNGVQASEQDPLLSWTAANVHPGVGRVEVRHFFCLVFYGLKQSKAVQLC